MALRNILEKGDAILNCKSRPVTEFDNARLNTLIDDMRETLLNAHGVGLAAPQVGVLRRVVLVINEEEEIIELINPEIIFTEGENEGVEGCLSVPGVWGIVKRPEHVIVKAQDRHGNPFQVEGYGLTARAFCHECAHLEGQLFTEVAERFLTEEELQELMNEAEEEADQASE